MRLSIPSGVIREKMTESQKHPLLETMAVKRISFWTRALKADGSFKNAADSYYRTKCRVSYTLIRSTARRPANKNVEEVRPSLEQLILTVISKYDARNG
jgi:hypothetical protein